MAKAKPTEQPKEEEPLRLPKLTGSFHLTDYSSSVQKSDSMLWSNDPYMSPGKVTAISVSPSPRPVAQIRLNLRKARISQNEHPDPEPPMGRLNYPIDREIPGPQAYSVTGKPLCETNAPSYSFGRRSWPEKPKGGGRTSWQKTWFHSPYVWTDKVDFTADNSWPEPPSYKVKTFLEKPLTFPKPPSYSMGMRLPMAMDKKGAEAEPAPNKYSLDESIKIVRPVANSYSHQFRRNGTLLWFENEKTPGPAAYNPRLTYCRPTRPIYSFKYKTKRDPCHELGPFAAF